MPQIVLRWFKRNLGSLILAFILAVIVWVSAVTAADPNQEQVFFVPLEMVGQDPDLDRLDEIPDRVELKLLAPISNLEKLSNANGSLRAWVDLSDYGPGIHTIPVNIDLPDDIRPVRLVDQDPETISLSLEQLKSITLPISTEVTGNPAFGYEAGETTWSDDEVSIAGRASRVDRVVEVRAKLNISGAEKSITNQVALQPVDEHGNIVSDVTLTPEFVSVQQEISLLGGYRNVVVRVVTTGQVADGYRTTNITPTPINVMVFSEDPELVDQLPGYIETEQLDLSGVEDDIEVRLALDLPLGVSVIGDSNVLVFVGVAALNNSITVSRQVEVIGLLPGLEALVAPDIIDVIIFGPVPDLNILAPSDVRIVVDLTGLEIGAHQVTPIVEILPDRITKEALIPETLEVIISAAPPSTPGADGESTETSEP